MSMEIYEQNRYDSIVYDKFQEVEFQPAGTMEQLIHDEAVDKTRELLRGTEKTSVPVRHRRGKSENP